MGVLFAGCAMYSFEDMFAVFVVRKAFKDSPKALANGWARLKFLMVTAVFWAMLQIADM